MTTNTEKRAAWREANRERIRAYDRARYAQRPASVKKRATDWRKAHPERARAINAKWREAHREQINARTTAARRAKGGDQRRRLALGVDSVAFQFRLAQQGGVCAVCRHAPTGRKGWQLDHDHNTGAVRGILCSPCNLGLGLLKDNPARLRAAAEYIDAHVSLQEIL